MTKLFCDLKTDEEKSAFFLSGRGYETGVIAHSIQNDVAMAYHRCAEYRKEMDALQAECERLTRYYKNGIDCFANPCKEHSGEKTPPFPEFFEKYGGQCLICVVDNNKALQAENERLRKDAERYRWLRQGHIKDVAVVRGLDAMDYGSSGVVSTYSEEIEGDDLDTAIDATMEQQA